MKTRAPPEVMFDPDAVHGARRSTGRRDRVTADEDQQPRRLSCSLIESLGPREALKALIKQGRVELGIT